MNSRSAPIPICAAWPNAGAAGLITLAVRRRGVTPELAALDLQPFAMPPDPALPDVAIELDHTETQHLRLPNDQGRQLEDAWFEQTQPDDTALNAALDAVVKGMRSGQLTGQTP